MGGVPFCITNFGQSVKAQDRHLFGKNHGSLVGAGGSILGITTDIDSWMPEFCDFYTIKPTVRI